MEVRTIDLSRERQLDCAAMAASIIDRIGEDSFAGELVAALSRHLRVGHLSAFAFSPARAPHLLGTGSVLSPLVAHDTAFVYLDRHYLVDPSRSLREAHATQHGRTLFLQRQRSHEILDEGYRTSCYDRPGIIDRVSMMQVCGYGQDAASDAWISVNLYRDRSQGFFSDGDVEALSAIAPVITRATSQHLRFTELRLALVTFAAPEATGGVLTDVPADAITRLLARFPHLSRREREVCAGILDGLTAKQIARRLDIAPTSVVTHRKNAYVKLGIRDLKQLFALTA